MSGVFINYRRDDAKAEAGRLFDWLSRYFGKDQVFMDVSGSIEPGLEFDRVIEKAVSSCDVLIVLIGKDWLTVTDENGKRRLDDPNDFVRMEVSAALKRDIRVIPVLVQEAVMPEEEQLPDDLKRLSKRQASEISDNRWEFDTELLVKVLEKTGVKAKPQQATVADAAATTAPDKGQTKIGWKALTSLIIGVLLIFMFSEATDTDTKISGLVFGVIALVLGIVAYFDAKHNPALRGGRGKSIAIAGISLSGLMSLAYIGTFNDGNQPVPIPDKLGEQDNPVIQKTLEPVHNEVVTKNSAAPAPININGPWRAQDGIYVFQQTGNSLVVQMFNWNQVLVAQGAGSIVQGVINVTYALIDNTGGEAKMQVSADGKQITGTYKNHATGEAGAIILVR